MNDVLPPFDHTSAEWRDNQKELLRLFHERCPFGHSDKCGGFWYALQAGTVKEAFNLPEKFVSSRGAVLPATVFPHTMIPINTDPPALYEWRSILNAHFSPQLMKSQESPLRKEAFELFDAALAKGRVDMVNDVAQPLTGKMTLRLLGLDPDDWAAYAVPFHQVVFSTVPWEEAEAAMKKMEGKLRSDIRARIGTPEATGLIKYLSEDAKFNGRPITEDEIWNILYIILGGGLDTTQSLVGSATVFLGENPDRQQELIDHPERLVGAIEEFLRVFPPTQNLARVAASDIEFKGVQFEENDRILVSLVGANHDPAEFPDPFKVDFEREPNRHFAFGMGPHRCLGSHLARIEAKVCLEALLDRAPGFGVEPDQHKHLAKSLGIFRAYEQVRLVLPTADNQ